MRKIMLLLLPIAALGFAPAPVFREKPNDPDAVLRRFEGDWRVVSCRSGGRNVMVGTTFRIRVEKDRWRFIEGTPAVQPIPFTIALDTLSKPMRIDWRKGGSHLKGIFALSGDRLHYSWRMADSGYPQSLSAPAPEDCVLEAEREK
jgi:uncharacterized protein (TIGR03067 family)